MALQSVSGTSHDAKHFVNTNDAIKSVGSDAGLQCLACGVELSNAPTLLHLGPYKCDARRARTVLILARTTLLCSLDYALLPFTMSAAMFLAAGSNNASRAYFNISFNPQPPNMLIFSSEIPARAILSAPVVRIECPVKRMHFTPSE